MVLATLSRLAEDLQTGRIARRTFIRQATTLGISAGAAAAIARGVEAQSATPSASPVASPVATPVAMVTKSITRDEYLKALFTEFPMEDPVTKGGTLLFSSAEEMDSANPINRSTGIAALVTGNIYSTIGVQNVMDGTMVPDLADYWEIGSDNKTYHFHLNPNILWHDGKQLTAHDCVFSFDAMLAEDNVAPYQGIVKGVTASYRAVDDLTFELVGIEPTATILENTIAIVPIMPKHIWESIPFDQWASAPGSVGSDPNQVIGCGAFKFVEWVQGDHVTLARNDDYFLPDLAPYVDQLSIRFVADPQAAVQAFVTGESDIGSVPPAEYPKFKADHPEFTYFEYDTWAWLSLITNVDPETGKFFTETGVRQALLYAIDRDMMVEKLIGGMGVTAHGVQPLPSPAYAPDKVRTRYNYDPEQAKSLLDAAGWVDTDGDGIREKDGVKMSIEINFDPSFGGNESMLAYLQEAWRAAGVELIQAQLVFDDILAGKFQIAMVGWGWNLPDQGALYRCDAMPPSGFNLSHYCNETYDQLNTDSVYELDPDKRVELLIDQSNEINDDVPWLPLYFLKAGAIAQPRVHNFYANGLAGVWSYNRMWIEQG